MNDVSPILYVIAGPNGAGKSSILKDFISLNVPILNGDDILE